MHFLFHPFHLKNDDRLEHMNLNRNWLTLAILGNEWKIVELAERMIKKIATENESLNKMISAFVRDTFRMERMNEILWFYWKNNFVTCLIASKSVIIIKIALKCNELKNACANRISITLNVDGHFICLSMHSAFVSPTVYTSILQLTIWKTIKI